MAPHDPPGGGGGDCPDHVRVLAEGCVRFVEQALGLTLDYTQDTLPILDHYLRQASDPDADAPGGQVPPDPIAAAKGEDGDELPPEPAGPELRALLVPAAGAYFGELVRRALPEARWHAPGEDYAAYRLRFAGFFLQFNPLGVAHEVIEGADAPGWHAHFAMRESERKLVEPTLAAGLSLREQDYYSLSVRYETLEHVASVLEAKAKQAPGPRATFSDRDYGTSEQD